jgi:hypothetical protein
MIVVAFVLALLAGMITLQVMMKTLRVPPGVSIAAEIVVGLAVAVAVLRFGWFT